MPDFGETAIAHSAQAVQETKGEIDRFLPRALEPIERRGIAAPGQDVEDGARKIDAMDLGFTVRPKTIERIPEPDGSSTGLTAGPSSALIRGILRDSFGGQAVDGAVCIVSGDLVKTAIDHSSHAGNRNRRFRDVGGDDDPPRCFVSGTERAVLFVGTEPAVER